MCAVGVDSSLSGWLTTYSHRADPGHAGAAALTTSLFWLGIMVSRLIFSTSLLAIIGGKGCFASRSGALQRLLCC